MTKSYYNTPKPSWLMKLFWKAAGGDQYLLERATYADQMKYMCLGGVIVSTGVMAGLAGGYAFYTIFSPKMSDSILKLRKVALANGTMYESAIDLNTVILSIIFGAIWGWIIFNIDRFIVTSTGKGDGTEAITLDEIKGAIPRIIMGAIIAITISKPVEIRMFESEIQMAVQMEQDSLRQKFKKQNLEELSIETKNKNAELNRFFKIDSLNSRISDATTRQQNTVDNTDGSGRGTGPIWKTNQNIIENLQLEKKVIENDPRYKQLRAELIKLEDEKSKKDKVDELRVASLDGLLIRMQKVHEIAGWPITIFITLLFMALELTPIFFKLMLTKTPYDYLEDNVKEISKAEHGIEVRYDFYRDKEGQERHLTINHVAERIIYEKIKATEAQKELVDYAIKRYISEQKLNIDANPEQYIKNS